MDGLRRSARSLALQRGHARTCSARILVCSLTILVVGLTGCGASSGSPPGPIVFSGRPDDPEAYGWQLLVMNPDGSGVRRLTRTDGDVAPSWSPDGTQVVFERATDIEGCDLSACAQIWIVDADGADERRLTPASTRSEAPDWSPDGDRIVFHQWDSDTDEIDIFVMSVDGSDLRQLTDASGQNEDPAWSPDGEHILFSRYVGDESEIYVMDAEGDELRPLTNTSESEYFPAWSPDGEQIVFERRDDVITIAVMNDDGSDDRTLFPPGAPDAGQPAWSPDGTQIAFTRYDDEIWVTDADGGNAHKLQAGPYSEPWGLDWAAARD